MNELDLHYPPDACPFCNIASAYPSSSISSRLWTPASVSLESCIPNDDEAHHEKTTPSSFVVLASRDVVAFLDILPMTGGHLLVATRGHRVKVADMEEGEGREIGEFERGIEKEEREPDSIIGFWLPVLARVVAKVTGVTDYNIVQNNGTSCMASGGLAFYLGMCCLSLIQLYQGQGPRKSSPTSTSTSFRGRRRCRRSRTRAGLCLGEDRGMIWMTRTGPG